MNDETCWLDEGPLARLIVQALGLLGRILILIYCGLWTYLIILILESLIKA